MKQKSAYFTNMKTESKIIIEIEKYVIGLNKNIVGKVFSDHPNGGTILKDVKGYASEGTIKSMKEGTIHKIVLLSN